MGDSRVPGGGRADLNSHTLSLPLFELGDDDENYTTIGAEVSRACKPILKI